MSERDLSIVFAELRDVMAKHAGDLVAGSESTNAVSFERPGSGGDGRSRWYGSVQTKKRYVSYHLMGVYEHPELLDDISEPLRKRMQGKSCFNFTAVDRELFDELDALTRTSFERCDEDGSAADGSAE